MSMPKLNAPAEIHWRRSNMNTRDPILMKSVEVLKYCRSLNAAAEMNCPMPCSVEKLPIRSEKRCSVSAVLKLRVQLHCDSLRSYLEAKLRYDSDSYIGVGPLCGFSLWQVRLDAWGICKNFALYPVHVNCTTQI